MKRLLVIITGVFAIISISVSAYFAYSYFSGNKGGNVQKEIREIEKEMKKVSSKMEEEKKKIEEVKKSNQDKIALLELWQKELAKLKN